jgi:hypothetical protein
MCKECHREKLKYIRRNKSKAVRLQKKFLSGQQLTALENKFLRASFALTLSPAIKYRDKYTCVLCGERGGDLTAHHIIPWSKDHSLRFDPQNIVTLCDDCHYNRAHAGSWRYTDPEIAERLTEYIKGYHDEDSWQKIAARFTEWEIMGRPETSIAKIAAKESGIKEGTIYYRLSHGWTLEDAKTIPLHVRKASAKPGEVTLAARANGVKDSTAQYRIRAGWSFEDATTAAPRAFGYKKFGNISRMAIEHGLSPGVVKGRMKREWTLEDALSVPSGDCISPIARAARKSGIKLETIRARVNRGWTLDEAKTIPPQKSIHVNGRFTAIDRGAQV